jgi:hypothetical protein
MPGTIYYQLINKTVSELDLVATVQNPTNWIPAAPATIAAGGNPSLNPFEPQDPGSIVFGYEMKGASTEQFWVIGSGGGESPAVAAFAPSGHSLSVNVTGNSEDGFEVALTYQ